MRRRTLVVPPGKMKGVETAAGPIQVIGGLDKFTIRRPGGDQANVPDTIYTAEQSLTIHRKKSDLIIRPFRTNPATSSPMLDSTV